MSDQSKTTSTVPEAPVETGGSARILKRLGVLAVVSLLTTTVLVLGIPWVCYRYSHVVLDEAVVKGVVTKIGARIDGRIKSIEVELGQHVSKGEVLLRLEDSSLQATTEQARAEVYSLTKQLETEKMAIEQARRQFTLEIERANGMRRSAAADVEGETSTLEKVEKQYERVSTLVKLGIATTNDLDQVLGDRGRSQAGVRALKGALQAAESNYRRAMADLEGLRVREAGLGILEAQIQTARAKVAVAEADLDATVIKAPEEGWVLDRIVELGGSAKVGEPMISLWIGRVWVEGWVDEKYLPKIGVGSLADVSFDAFPRRKLSGRVEMIGMVSDKQLQLLPVPPTLHAFVTPSAMVPIRVVLEDTNCRVRLGLSAVVGIRKKSQTSELEGHAWLYQLLPWAQSRASSK